MTEYRKSNIESIPWSSHMGYGLGLERFFVEKGFIHIFKVVQEYERAVIFRLVSSKPWNSLTINFQNVQNFTVQIGHKMILK